MRENIYRYILNATTQRKFLLYLYIEMDDREASSICRHIDTYAQYAHNPNGPSLIHPKNNDDEDHSCLSLTLPSES